MPLFMDIHTVDSDEFSAKDVVEAHMEDLAIQDQFGVKQLKYWVNEQARTIFCLMEGPDKDACNQVHLQSHGNTACNIIEVADNEYNLFMGQGTDVDDLAKTDSGELDTGYRSILLTNIFCFNQVHDTFTEKVNQLIKDCNGVIVLEPSNQIMVTFMNATDSISCANSITDFLNASSNNLQFNIAVVSGKPVDEDGDTFFEETKAKINSLCSLGLSNKMYLDQETLSLSGKEKTTLKGELNNHTLVHKDDFEFSLRLSSIINKYYLRSDFSSKRLIVEMGMSKSTIGRRIKSLTGMSPNQLIQESRLQRALNLMSEKDNTIAEVAYETGFNSPTYYTRLFKKRFGVSPTHFSEQQS